MEKIQLSGYSQKEIGRKSQPEGYYREPACTPLSGSSVHTKSFIVDSLQAALNTSIRIKSTMQHRIIRQASRSFATSAATSSSAPIKASLVLSRAPIVTKDIPEFEKLFYNYQEELERRLMWTFPKWYYFKKGTVAEREFTEAQKYPVPAQKGVWFPQGVPDIKHGRDRRFKQEVILPKKEVEVEATAEGSNDTAAALADLDNIGRAIKTNSRVTKYDEANDQTSLERKLPRTLYLIVKESGAWRFPSFEVKQDGSEQKGLHQIAEDGLRTIGGDKINTWSVSNSPAAVIKYDTKGKIAEAKTDGPALTREFLMKSHIIAGKFDLQKDSKKVSEYKWLVKEEIQNLVDKAYFDKISHLLHDN